MSFEKQVIVELERLQLRVRVLELQQEITMWQETFRKKVLKEPPSKSDLKYQTKMITDIQKTIVKLQKKCNAIKDAI